MTEFANKKVIVTGVTRGIGLAIAQAYLREGATVIGIYRQNQEAADKLLAASRQCLNQVVLYRCNVSDPQDVASFFRLIEERFADVDILINNAGIRCDAVLAMMSIPDWQRVIDTNLTGTFLMSKYAVPLMMKNKWGRIITITSPVAYMGFAGQANYAASKAGQIGMMKSLAKETARKKITVNCVSPGFIDTEFLDGLSEEQKADYKRMVPMRRFGKPEEVADAVLFLSSEKAGYISGSVLEINGGL
ncbi:MAG: SDR family NAD(P)-dependent oxidoreductase [Desulfocapsaceae bacterium]|nr:SDR family NAD(P)-dependent oxidoreductase [Desulfocapsaceae bacterium]